MIMNMTNEIWLCTLILLHTIFLLAWKETLETNRPFTCLVSEMLLKFLHTVGKHYSAGRWDAERMRDGGREVNLEVILSKSTLREKKRGPITEKWKGTDRLIKPILQTKTPWRWIGLGRYKNLTWGTGEWDGSRTFISDGKRESEDPERRRNI